MTVVNVGEPIGTCVRPSCPANQPSGHCERGLQRIVCQDFEPDPQSEHDALDATSTEDAVIPSPAVAGVRLHEDELDLGGPTFAEHGSSATNNDAATGGSELETGTASEANVQQTGDIRRSNDPTGDSGVKYRSVSRPQGPRNEVSFADADKVALRSGLALNSDEARRIMRSESVTLVLFAGAPKSGKTTILSAIYESLLDGPIGQWQFAGSDTLLGFAMRSWYASTASGLESPDTERTRYEIGRPWLHLRLRKTDGSLTKTILIADLSGEYFRAVGSGGGLGDAADIVARADHIVHLLDAELLITKRERLRALDAAESLLMRMVTTPHVHDRATHVIAIAKSDLCSAEVLDMAKAAARRWSVRWLGGASIIEIAARPQDASLPRGLGMVFDNVFLGSDSGNAPMQCVVPRELRTSVARLARSGVELSRVRESSNTT